MRSLWLAAALAAGVALGGWNLPQVRAGDGHGHNNHGHSQHGNHYGHGHQSHYHAGHNHGNYGYGNYGRGNYGQYRSGYGTYGNVYYGGYAPYGGYSPYGGLRNGTSIYSSGYRGLGYSNFGVGPSLGVGIGGMYGAPFGGFRF